MPSGWFPINMLLLHPSAHCRWHFFPRRLRRKPGSTFLLFSFPTYDSSVSFIDSVFQIRVCPLPCCSSGPSHLPSPAWTAVGPQFSPLFSCHTCAHHVAADLRGFQKTWVNPRLLPSGHSLPLFTPFFPLLLFTLFLPLWLPLSSLADMPPLILHLSLPFWPGFSGNDLSLRGFCLLSMWEASSHYQTYLHMCSLPTCTVSEILRNLPCINTPQCKLHGCREHTQPVYTQLHP